LDDQARAAREADNEAQLKEIRKQRHDLMQPLIALRRQHMEKFRGILTADQKKTLEQAREEFKERRGKGPNGPKDAPPTE
jgi:hypothetical protein